MEVVEPDDHDSETPQAIDIEAEPAALNAGDRTTTLGAITTTDHGGGAEAASMCNSGCASDGRCTHLVRY